MKSGKYKFSSDSTADCVARQYLLKFYLLRNLFFRYFHRINAIYDMQLQTVLSEKWNFVQLLFIQEFLAYANRRGVFTH